VSADRRFLSPGQRHFVTESEGEVDESQIFRSP
jgi:hypothetical protein